MKRLFRILCGLLTLVLVALSTVSCSASRPVYASPRAAKTVARAGEVEILYEELYFITQNYIKELKITYGEDALADEAVRRELEDFVWSKLLTEETALVSLGYKYGLDVYKDDLKDSVAADIDAVVTESFEGDRKAYIASLAEMHMTDHYARKYFGVQEHLANAIVLEMLHRKELDTDDESVLAHINGENFIRTKHVFVKNLTNDAAGDAAARATAESIRASLLAIADQNDRHTAMNQAIAGPHNHDFGDTLGQGYYFARGEMTTAYEEIAFSLTDYAVGELLKTSEGYYVIMRLPKDAAYIEENFQSLKEKSYFVVLNARVEAELAAMTLEKTRFGESLDLTNLPDIDPDGGSVAITVGAVILGVLAVGGFVFVVARSLRRRRGVPQKIR